MMPVAGAVEAFLAIYNNLPYAISAYIDLVIALSIVAGVIAIVLKL